jgi:putative flippase GtrA
LVDYGITIGLSALGLAPLWAKSWATLAGFAGNFILRRWLVFRDKR